MSFSFGNNFTVQIFGASHADAVGVVLDGLPAGERMDLSAVRRFMERRAPGKNAYSTARRETDEPEVLSGILEGVTTGAPICAVIRNTDMHSGDYRDFQQIPRPGHGDYPAFIKFGGANDVRGGGAFSGRMTAPLCFAGALCTQILRRSGMEIFAHIDAIAGISDALVNNCTPDITSLRSVKDKCFPVIEDSEGEKMQRAVEAAKADGDSVGGSIECLVTGVPVGLGSHMFDGVENRMAAALFGIPAVKGVEFGSGFAGSLLRGSENNDPYAVQNGKIVTTSNAHGGILGGMTTGMPIRFRVAIKPTPSISKPQQSVDIINMQETELRIRGRHDPCIVPRAVPVVEAMAAIVMLDLLYDKN